MSRIIILDFESTMVHIFNYDKNIYKESDFDIFINDLNIEKGYEFKESMCEWMVVDELKIHIN